MRCDYAARDGRPIRSLQLGREECLEHLIREPSEIPDPCLDITRFSILTVSARMTTRGIGAETFRLKTRSSSDSGSTCKNCTRSARTTPAFSLTSATRLTFRAIASARTSGANPDDFFMPTSELGSLALAHQLRIPKALASAVAVRPISSSTPQFGCSVATGRQRCPALALLHGSRDYLLHGAVMPPSPIRATRPTRAVPYSGSDVQLRLLRSVIASRTRYNRETCRPTQSAAFQYESAVPIPATQANLDREWFPITKAVRKHQCMGQASAEPLSAIRRQFLSTSDQAFNQPC